MAEFLLAESSYDFPLAVPPDDSTQQVGGLGSQVWNNPVSTVVQVPGTGLANMLLTAQNDSTFMVREEIKLELNLYNMIKIDADFQYYKTKYKLGSWQKLDKTTGAVLEWGYIEYPEHVLSNIYQTKVYAATDLESLLSRLWGKFEVKWCDFDLAPAIVPNDYAGGVPPLVPGYRLTQNPNPFLYGKFDAFVNGISDVLWLNWQLSSQISYQQLGLFLLPGVAITRVMWKLVGVNQHQGVVLSSSFDPILQGVNNCQNPVTADCPEQFAQFLADGLPNGIFSEFAACQASFVGNPNESCDLNTWVCPNNPNFTRPYYVYNFSGN